MRAPGHNPEVQPRPPALFAHADSTRSSSPPRFSPHRGPWSTLGGTWSALCLALWLAVIGCAEPASRGAARSEECAGRDILLVTADTLRADHLSLYGYSRPTSPGLERWFGDAALFAHAYSTTGSTPMSSVSFLSGLLPQEHGVRLFYQLLPEETPILPDLLPRCYQSAAFISNLVLGDEALGIGHRFDHFDDYMADQRPKRSLYERTATKTTDAALTWLVEERDEQRPLFLWVHYIDPHAPYEPPPSWERSFTHDEPLLIDLERLPPSQRVDGIDDGRTLIDLYDEEIAYMDTEIDRLLDGYARLAPIAEAMVLFTADHGESMMDHELWFAHGYQVYEEILRVPLMVLAPGVEPGWREDPASGVDVVPTILAFAGAPAPPELRGRDLRHAGHSAAGSPPEQRLVFLEAFKDDRHWRAAVRGREKWVAQVTAEGEVLTSQYYDLRRDPLELSPRPWPSVRGRPVEELMTLIEVDPSPFAVPEDAERGTRRREPKIDPRANDEALEKLKALGYVG